jgi:hypothetical protein
MGMKFRAGDKVKFLNDTGSGEIVSFIDKKTALVMIEDGFEVPVLLTDLVVEAGVYYETDDEPVIEDDSQVSAPARETGQSVQPHRASSGRSSQRPESGRVEPEQEGGDPVEDDEIVLIFVPGAERSDFKVYLANSSSYNLKYTLSRNVEGEQVLFGEGELEAGLKIYLGKYAPVNLQDEEAFRIQALFYNDRFYNHIKPLDALIRHEVSDMYDSSNWQENDYFDEKAIVHVLHDWKIKKDPIPEIDPEQIKKAMYTKGDVKPEKKPAKNEDLVEVDLHINELTDTPGTLSNAEILDLQLSAFRTALDSAILHKNRRIVFIHGVGNGKLKHELRRILDREYNRLRYQDASFKEYGYGATMVLL